MYTCIICRYHEIATKGNNRSMFENKLVENLQYQCETLEKLEGLQFSRVRGRIYIRRRDRASFTGDQLTGIRSGLSRCAGLETFSPALECKPDMKEILDTMAQGLHEHFDPVIEKKGKVRFRIRARRSDKSFPLISQEIEVAAATRAEEIFGEAKLKVDLTNPEVTVGIEVRDVNALVYYTAYAACGGLPTGCNSPVLAMLSGGIDSSVACKMIMNRGCHVDFLTFHSYPYTPMASVEKVQKLAAVLNRHQKPGKLFACNLSEIQKCIRDKCHEKYRTVLYRRMMVRIANMICERQKLFAVVTGDSVGQVASQTVINMGTIAAASKYLILRPLCGMDKQETIRRAEALGTFEISIDPQPDSCTVFAPPQPAVAARLYDIEHEEAKMGDFQELLEKAYSEMMIL